LSGWVEMMPWGTYSSLSHKHLFSRHALPIVANRKLGVKEVGNNSIGGLDSLGNDEFTSAWGIQYHFYNHIGFIFPMDMFDDNGDMMR
jgi:hypothetical protein